MFLPRAQFGTETRDVIEVSLASQRILSLLVLDCVKTQQILGMCPSQDPSPVALVQKTLIKLACVVSAGPLRLTMICLHCFELDAMVSGTRREGEDSLWPEKFSIFLSLKQSDTLLTLRSLVLMISPLECASSFSMRVFYRCSSTYKRMYFCEFVSLSISI